MQANSQKNIKFQFDLIKKQLHIYINLTLQFVKLFKCPINRSTGSLGSIEYDQKCQQFSKIRDEEIRSYQMRQLVKQLRSID
jgi:hypothetical protein